MLIYFKSFIYIIINEFLHNLISQGSHKLHENT